MEEEIKQLKERVDNLERNLKILAELMRDAISQINKMLSEIIKSYENFNEKLGKIIKYEDLLKEEVQKLENLSKDIIEIKNMIKEREEKAKELLKTLYGIIG